MFHSSIYWREFLLCVVVERWISQLFYFFQRLITFHYKKFVSVLLFQLICLQPCATGSWSVLQDTSSASSKIHLLPSAPAWLPVTAWCPTPVGLNWIKLQVESPLMSQLSDSQNVSSHSLQLNQQPGQKVFNLWLTPPCTRVIIPDKLIMRLCCLKPVFIFPST